MCLFRCYGTIIFDKLAGKHVQQVCVSFLPVFDGVCYNIRDLRKNLKLPRSKVISIRR